MYYRPYMDEDATWFQMYETVTEGTPCTPPFATKSELVDYLVSYGEMHGTEYERRYSRESAQAFVEDEWAPSMILSLSPSGNPTLITGADIPLTMQKIGAERDRRG